MEQVLNNYAWRLWCMCELFRHQSHFAAKMKLVCVIVSTVVTASTEDLAQVHVLVMMRPNYCQW
jgi:hypothetical protein